jgi:hypothetical protein
MRWGRFRTFEAGRADETIGIRLLICNLRNLRMISSSLSNITFRGTSALLQRESSRVYSAKRFEFRTFLFNVSLAPGV